MSTIPPDLPGLAESDIKIAATAIALELTARDLYDEVSQATDLALWRQFREQHEAFAIRVAGISGVSADTIDDDVSAQFPATLTTDVVAAALQVENQLAATHTALVGEILDNPLAKAIASIAVMESRQALFLSTEPEIADVDLTGLFDNPATSLLEA